MALSETFQTSTVFLKICIFLTPLGCLLHLIGLSTNNWSYGEVNIGNNALLGMFKVSSIQKISRGLWKGCWNDVCSSYQNTPGWLDAVRAMAILGFMACIATAALVLLCTFITTFSQKKVCHIGALVASLAATAFIFLAIIIFGAKDKTDGVNMSPHYSFGLCATAAVIFLVASVLLILNLLRKRD